jgi:hypothetical protein
MLYRMIVDPRPSIIKSAAEQRGVEQLEELLKTVMKIWTAEIYSRNG